MLDLFQIITICVCLILLGDKEEQYKAFNNVAVTMTILLACDEMFDIITEYVGETYFETEEDEISLGIIFG